MSAALAELERLVRETSERCDAAEYVEAMGSLAALEPVRQLLLEEMAKRWSALLAASGRPERHGVYL